MNSVTVLMSTYNGEKYLVEQLESVLGQKDVELSILVRDDGSTDNTKGILQQYQEKGLLKWYSGQNLRSAKSFLDLVYTASGTDYYAFCDQDDVWNEDKLCRAIGALEKQGDAKLPRLYCSNYQLVDAELNNLPDNGHVSTTTFEAALVSSCCTGCTCVFNNALRLVLKEGAPNVIVMHDDWVHKVCLAVGGTVVYDEYRSLKYRQHGGNVDGGVHGIRQKVHNIQVRFKTKECIRTNQIIEILHIYGDDMSEHNKKLAEMIIKAKEGNIIPRLMVILNKEIKTPFSRLNRGFYAAILFGYY